MNDWNNVDKLILWGHFVNVQKKYKTIKNIIKKDNYANIGFNICLSQNAIYFAKINVQIYKCTNTYTNKYTYTISFFF